MDGAGLRRLDSTYEILMESYHHQNNLEGAILLLDEMKDAGIEPRQRTQELFIDLAARAGEPALALEIASQLESDRGATLGPQLWMSILHSSLDESYVRIPFP
jgi:pentatricopeptide repeat protein